MAQSVIRLHLNRRTGLNPWPVHMTFVEEQVALGQVFIRVLLYSPVDHSTNTQFSFTQAVIYKVIIRKDSVDITYLPQGWRMLDRPS